MVELIIRNGTVVTPDGEYPADVLIQDGKIAGVVGQGTSVPTEQVLDATGLHILPGVIDPHIHLPSRGQSFADTCDIFSRTQVAGGTTSAISFVFAPTGGYVPVIEEMAAAVRAHAITDMGAAPILMNREHIAEIPELVERWGITSFKVFMANQGRRELYRNTWSMDDGLIWLALCQAARTRPQPIIHVHAENLEIAEALTEDIRAAGRDDAPAWTEARPNLCEEDSLRQFAFWLGKAGAAGYAVHLSTREAPAIIAKARARGIQLYGETCPHYLTHYDQHPGALMAKYQPSIKSREDTEALWAGIRAGWIHCIGSDSVAVTLATKNMEKGLWGIYLGTPGSGTILPVMLHYGVHAGRIALSDVVRSCSLNTARILGLYPRKGTILPGADADLVLVDLKKEVTVTPELLNIDFSLYDGERFTGWPRVTLVGGRVVCEDGHITVPVSGGRDLWRPLPERAAIL